MRKSAATFFLEDGFRMLTFREGLAGTSVTDIITDHNGEMWIATSNGVNTYNGKRLTTFKLGEESLQNHVYHVYEAPDHHILATTANGIYSIAFDHKTDSVAYYTLKGSLQYSQGAINLNCTLPIGDGAMVDYQSMAENYADSTVVVQTVMLKDYEKATDGIAATQKPAAKAEKAYSLSGQQLDALRHPGIYIVNRRKVIVR